MRTINSKRELEKAIKDGETEFNVEDSLFDKKMRVVAYTQANDGFKPNAGAIAEGIIITALIVIGVLTLVAMLKDYDVVVTFDPTTGTFKLDYKKK